MCTCSVCRGPVQPPGRTWWSPWRECRDQERLCQSVEPRECPADSSPPSSTTNTITHFQLTNTLNSWLSIHKNHLKDLFKHPTSVCIFQIYTEGICRVKNSLHSLDYFFREFKPHQRQAKLQWKQVFFCLTLEHKGKIQEAHREKSTYIRRDSLHLFKVAGIAD